MMQLTGGWDDVHHIKRKKVEASREPFANDKHLLAHRTTESNKDKMDTGATPTTSFISSSSLSSVVHQGWPR